MTGLVISTVYSHPVIFAGPFTRTVAADNDPAMTVCDTVRFDVVEQKGQCIEIWLSLSDPVVDSVQRPPAEPKRLGDWSTVPVLTGSRSIVAND